MGTYAEFCAEVRKDGKWEINNEDVFPFGEYAWQRKPGDVRERWEFPFHYQNYGLFGFLAGIRNCSETTSLSKPRGLPEDACDDAVDLLARHGGYSDQGFGDITEEVLTVADRVSYGCGDSYAYSWVSLAEMLAFDYGQSFVDKRESPPLTTTYREFLGEAYFEQVRVLQTLGAPNDVRILFCFNG